MIKYATKYPSTALVVSTALSVILSIGFALLLDRAFQYKETWLLDLLFLASLILPYVLPTLIVGFALYQSFRQHEFPRTRFRVIVFAYLCMIFVFTGIYFSMAFVADHDYAISCYSHYHYAWQEPSESKSKSAHILPFVAEPRAFTGIDEHLWSTVDDSIGRYLMSFQPDPELYRSQVAQRSYADIVRFRMRAVPDALSDCLHLSVMTITTVGYGNIAPSRWYSKLATDIEALTGTALFVIALGMAFSQWNPSSQSKNCPGTP